MRRSSRFGFFIEIFSPLRLRRRFQLTSDGFPQHPGLFIMNIVSRLPKHYCILVDGAHVCGAHHRIQCAGRQPERYLNQREYLRNRGTNRAVGSRVETHLVPTGNLEDTVAGFGIADIDQSVKTRNLEIAVDGLVPSGKSAGGLASHFMTFSYVVGRPTQFHTECKQPADVRAKPARTEQSSNRSPE